MSCFLAVLIILVVLLLVLGFLAYLGKCPDCPHPGHCLCLVACDEMEERLRRWDDEEQL